MHNRFSIGPSSRTSMYLPVMLGRSCLGQEVIGWSDSSDVDRAARLLFENIVSKLNAANASLIGIDL